MFFNLYECCRVVSGAMLSLLVDLQRECCFHISNDLADAILQSLGKGLDETIIVFESNSIDDAGLVIQELVKEEFVFFSCRDDSFVEMKTEWDEPCIISNAIVDLGDVIMDYSTIWPQLAELGCEYVQLRLFQEMCLVRLLGILSMADNDRILSIELILPYVNDQFSSAVQDYVEGVARYVKVVFFGAPSDMVKCIEGPGGRTVEYSTRYITGKQCCGIVDSVMFISNSKFFSESLGFNSCLNAKFSIDSEGYIRNCPSMPESYGNIRDVAIADAIEKPMFKKYWRVSKDLISVCKDCEFRYVCTDCRAYVEDPQDTSGPEGTNLSKPLKCGYNPYTGEWAEWSTNPLKQKAIEFYEMDKLVADRLDRLAMQ